MACILKVTSTSCWRIVERRAAASVASRRVGVAAAVAVQHGARAQRAHTALLAQGVNEHERVAGSISRRSTQCCAPKQARRLVGALRKQRDVLLVVRVRVRAGRLVQIRAITKNCAADAQWRKVLDSFAQPDLKLERDAANVLVRL